MKKRLAPILLALALPVFTCRAADIVLYSTTQTSASEWPAMVPRTGQTNIYAEGVDDGSLMRGVPWPVPRQVVVGAEGTAETNQVRDTLTGIIWARDASLLATNWAGAFYYITNVMNVAGYGGSTNWRLPSLREMHSLVSYQYNAPALCNSNCTAKWAAGNSPFRGVIGNGLPYWSGTTYVGLTDRAWGVEFAAGDPGYFTKTISTYYFWPVIDRYP